MRVRFDAATQQFEPIVTVCYYCGKEGSCGHDAQIPKAAQHVMHHLLERASYAQIDGMRNTSCPNCGRPWSEHEGDNCPLSDFVLMLDQWIEGLDELMQAADRIRLVNGRQARTASNNI